MKLRVPQPHALLLFVRRDFVATCRQTVLGPLWCLIQPLLTALTFTVIFGRVAHLVTFAVQLLMYATPVSRENSP